MIPSPGKSSGRRVVVTCGPAHAPLDDMRRLTNASTGEIGTLLARAFHDAGWEVICLRGEGSTAPVPEHGTIRTFGTNQSLADLVHPLDPDVLLHAAALCDFEVGSPAGGVRKIPTRSGPVTIQLQPAIKWLPRFAAWFPHSLVIGWKFECDGDHSDALAAGQRQIQECHTAACVVNGPAYGPGFGLLTPDGQELHSPTKSDLARNLVEFTTRQAPPPAPGI